MEETNEEETEDEDELETCVQGILDLGRGENQVNMNDEEENQVNINDEERDLGDNNDVEEDGMMDVRNEIHPLALLNIFEMGNDALNELDIPKMRHHQKMQMKRAETFMLKTYADVTNMKYDITEKN